ncbi:MAG TPA: hypothetical protein VMI12_08495 [Puia sp.]|nr:hypothetical protein [Puia sp.]
MKYGKYRVTKKLTDDVENWSELYVPHQSIENSMDTQQNMDGRLWDYIDGLSNPEEKSAIEKLIETNLEWQRTYHELLHAHQLMNSTELDEPSLRFTKNVMEEIAKYHVAPATRSYINKKIIWGIGGFFLTMILGFLIYSFSQINWTISSGSSDPLSGINLDKLNWGKFFNNTYTNIFMMINVVLGLILLDMYLHRKKERARHKEA